MDRCTNHLDIIEMIYKAIVQMRITYRHQIEDSSERETFPEKSKKKKTLWEKEKNTCNQHFLIFLQFSQCH